MRRRIILRIAVVAAVLVTMLAAPAAAGRGAAVERPWKERTTGDTIVAFAACDLSNLPVVTCPTLLQYRVIGTHVGRAELTAVGVATLDLSQSCERPDGLTGVPARNDTDEVIVAPDGSELHSHTFYDNCVVPGDDGPSDFTGVRSITGGTGRFDGATGSVALTGVQLSGVGGPIEMAGAGTITY